MIKDFIMPSTLEEGLNILSSNGKDSIVLAGGTDLIIDLKKGKYSKEIIMGIEHLKELKFIHIEDEILIGAGSKFTDIVENKEIKKHVYGLWKACKSIGSPQIRNMATIGGNICNASPSADSVPPLLALDAELIIVGKDKRRTIPLNGFYSDKGIDLKEDELLYAVKFHKPKENEGISFEKLGLRKALAISRISCSVYIALKENRWIKEIKIATGALGKYPQREIKIEDLLKNKEVNESILDCAVKEMCCLVEERLKGRSSMNFKKEAVKGLFIKAFQDALKEATKHEKNQPDNK